jgi:acetoin utilization protein AcuB
MPVTEAAVMLNRKNFRHLPVVDEGNRLLGMVTDRDLRSACPSSMLSSEERQQVLEKVKETKIREIMSTDFVSLQPTSTLDDALLLFKTRSIGAMPVIDNQGKVVGIFSLNDMMTAYRRLFGLGEKGSVLVAIEDGGGQVRLGDLVHALEKEKVPFTRLIRAEGQGREPAMLYLRVNTMNIRTVHRIIEETGFTVHVPVVTQ